MAMITCPECGNSVSDKAKTCIHCGCPLSEVSKTGVVRIKIPNNIAEGAWFPSTLRAAVIADGKTLWEGKHGQTANFTIDAPTNITIELGRAANPVEDIVYPNKRYTLVQDMGLHLLATYHLNEIDVIDSD